MPGTTIGTSLNYGFAGQPAQTNDLVIKRRTVKTGTSNVTFGAPVMLNTDNTVQLGDANMTAALFHGIAAAEVKQGMVYNSGTLTQNGFYAPLQPADIIRRGTVVVSCNVGTPTAGGKVYQRISTHTGVTNGVVGGLEATADSSHTVELTNCVWESNQIDANGMAVLTIKSINN